MEMENLDIATFTYFFNIYKDPILRYAKKKLSAVEFLDLLHNANNYLDIVKTLIKENYTNEAKFHFTFEMVANFRELINEIAGKMEMLDFYANESLSTFGGIVICNREDSE